MARGLESARISGGADVMLALLVVGLGVLVGLMIGRALS